MIRAGLVGVAALAAGALAAHFLLQDNGYVLVAAGPYVLETSLPVLALALVAVLALAHGLVRLARVPRAAGTALSARRDRAAGDKRLRGLVALVHGDLERGDRLLGRAARRASPELAECLVAARAAARHGARERRDAWLAAAHTAAPAAATAVLLTRAELELEAGELEAARGTLERLRAQRRDDPAARDLGARIDRAEAEAGSSAA